MSSFTICRLLCITATPRGVCPTHTGETTEDYRAPTCKQGFDPATKGQHAVCPYSAYCYQSQTWCTLPCQRRYRRLPTLQWPIRAEKVEVLPDYAKMEMGALRMTLTQDLAPCSARGSFSPQKRAVRSSCCCCSLSAPAQGGMAGGRSFWHWRGRERRGGGEAAAAIACRSERANGLLAWLSARG